MAIVQFVCEGLVWLIGSAGLVLVVAIWRGVFDEDVPG